MMERVNISKEAERQQIMRECYDCAHKRDVPGNCHIRCANPDQEMSGHAHGIKNGWFFYPLLFDPVWKTKACTNYCPKSEQT